MLSFKRGLIAAALAITLAAGSCDDDAKVATANIIKAADNFEVNRKIVFYNSVKDKYMLEIIGRCSMDLNKDSTAYNAICKVGPNEFKRHTLVLNAVTTAFVEQIDPVQASAYYYRVTFKPQVLFGDKDIDLRINGKEAVSNMSEANQ